MTERNICKEFGNELFNWRQKLQHVTDKIDQMPSIDKYKLTPHIEGLHILLTELEDRINLFEKECPADIGKEEQELHVKLGELESRFNQTEGIVYDYDFGG